MNNDSAREDTMGKIRDEIKRFIKNSESFRKNHLNRKEDTEEIWIPEQSLEAQKRFSGKRYATEADSEEEKKHPDCD